MLFRLSRKLISVLAILLSLTATSSFATLTGNVEFADCEHVAGWAWDDVNPAKRVKLSIYDGKTRLATVTAQALRRDLQELGIGDGKYGFYLLLPPSVRNQKTHSLSVRFADTSAHLTGSPITTLPCYGKLNDTGWQKCSDLAVIQNCPVTSFAGQDGDYGRDSLALLGKLLKIGKGDEGFDFTKIANDGSKLTPIATLGGGSKNWACTFDNVTGLLWEIKTTDGGLRDKTNAYSWYNTDNLTNGGNSGFPAMGICTGGIVCNTEAYKNAVNSINLCGKNNWRIPRRNEVLSIVKYNVVDPAIDTNYFPNVDNLRYWSFSTYQYYPEYAWLIDFSGGASGYDHKSNPFRVMLVSGQ